MHQCTMWLSFSKSSSRENLFLCSHFIEIWLFQTEYLEIVLCSVSLLIYIWGLVEHGHMQKNNFQKNQLQFQQAAGRMWKRLWDELNVICKNKAPNIWRGEKRMQISSYFKTDFHNERGLGPKRCFQVFFRAPQNLSARQISKWPDTPFRFFANRYPIFGKYITGIFFLQYSNSSLPVRTGIIIFGSKLSKN